MIQNPKLIGETTVDEIKLHFEGKTTARVVPVAVGIVDKDMLKENAAK